MKNLIIAFMLLYGASACSQDFSCGHGEIHQKMILEDSTYLNEMKSLENHMISAVSKSSGELITIPVVFHIIHKGEPIGTGTNISDAQIYSAINSTNEHLRKSLNTPGDGNGADFNVELCLANIGPNGLPTTGINRVNGCTVTDYCSEGITAGQGQGASETAIKNLSRWNNQEYYNIWIVSEIENNNGGGGIQGYAYFPTTSIIDGIVQLYNATGTEGNLKSYTNENKTLTHEFGHAFALFHTWGSGPQPGFAGCNEVNCALQQDRVCDTEPSTGIEWCGQTANSCPGVGNSIAENYMSYAQETCKSKFTQGQVDRGRQALAFSRANLITSDKCSGDRPYASYQLEIISPENDVICPEEHIIGVNITNTSSELIHYIDLTLTINGTETDLLYNFPLGPGQDDQVYFGYHDFETGITEIRVDGNFVNGNPSGLFVERSFTVTENEPIIVEFELDALGGQNYWVILDEIDQIIYQSQTYPNFQSGDIFTESVCLPDGCFKLVLYDSAGNGICCGNGSGEFRVFDGAGTQVFTASEFTDSVEFEFCITLNELPVELTAFETECKDDGTVVIYWQTASESNSDYWELWRSENLQSVSILDYAELIETIGAAGASTQTVNYTAYDFQPVEQGYYILKQFDLDGSLSVYGPISEKCEFNAPCGIIVDGQNIYSLNNEEFLVYGYMGNLIQNPSYLDPGIYIIVTKNCKVKVIIQKK